MKIQMTILAGFAAVLAACGQNAEAPAGEGAGEMAGMEEMQPVTAPVEVQSRGMVTAIDRAGQTITVDHEPIPAVGWPSMNMGFAIDPALLEGVGIGDQVAFDLTVEGNAGTITALSKE